jgi:uncharacterized damage-inducible protein DinB
MCHRGFGRLLVVGALLASPVPAIGQDAGAGAGLIGAALQPYESVRDHVLQTARNAPAEVLSYRPTEDTRSFRELLGHIANASYAFCSAALGESSPGTQNFEQVEDREALTRGLEEAFAYCDRAHGALDDAQLVEQVELFGQTGSRLWVLVFNATHTWEHYGNLVTYMRLNGIVPPSSGGLTGGGF